MSNKMHRWLMGFLVGILFHWLIAFLSCFMGEDEILVPALSRNFQYTFLSVTTLLWGILGGTIFSLWAYSKEMKAKGLTRRYFASLGFLVGSVGLGVPLLLLNFLPEKLWLSIPKPLFFWVGVLSLLKFVAFSLLAGTLRNIGFRGLTDEIIAPFAGTTMLVEFLHFVYCGIIGRATGYLVGFFKEKLSLKRSGSDEEKD